MTHFDFCVVGNGMVGSAMTLGLAKLGFRIAWVCPEKLTIDPNIDEPDVRVSAISTGSIALLKTLGAWTHLPKHRVKPYTAMRVWEANSDAVIFNAQQLNQEQLGVFVENQHIQLACKAAIQPLVDDLTSIAIFPEMHVISTEAGLANEPARVTLSNGEIIKTTWIVGADGGQSKVRELAGIGTQGWLYQQQALGIVVELQQPSGSETWQQFQPDGPKALLPLHDNYAALVWYAHPDTLIPLKKLDDSTLLKRIKQTFPPCLPDIKRVVSRAQFPLARMHAEQYIKGSSILVGDAAHTVNPLAGQGVNMGFADVTKLLNTLKETRQSNDLQDLACAAVKTSLNTNFADPQRFRNAVMQLALEVCYQSFKPTGKSWQLLRGLTLKMADKALPAKRQLIQFASGLSEEFTL